MRQGTFKITVTGSVNLLAALVTAGWKGTAQAASLLIYNANAETVYVTLSADGRTAPSVPTDGFPVGTSAPSTSFAIEPPNGFVDAATLWLYAANAAVLKIQIIEI